MLSLPKAHRRDLPFLVDASREQFRSLPQIALRRSHLQNLKEAIGRFLHIRSKENPIVVDVHGEFPRQRDGNRRPGRVLQVRPLRPW